MSKFLIKVTEVYRCDTDEEAKALIESSKHSSMWELTGYSSKYKEVKKKGELVDDYFVTTLNKTFNSEKDPSFDVMPKYSAESDDTEEGAF